MRKIFLALALALPVILIRHAIASEETAVMAPIHQFFDGFNKGDLEAAVAACADEASVIDDFPPHEWHGKGCEKWADAFKALAKKDGITRAKISFGSPKHIDVNDERAYVVIPVTLVVNRSQKQKKLPSIFTAALHKEAGVWRIAAWAWADL
jgi:hypothetical protein